MTSNQQRMLLYRSADSHRWIFCLLVIIAACGVAPAQDYSRPQMVPQLSRLIVDAVFSPDGTIIYTGSSEGIICAWEVDSGRMIRQFCAHATAIRSIAISPNGTELLSEDENGMVCVWAVRTGTMRLLQQPGEGVYGKRLAAFSSDGSLVATTRGKSIIVWDTTTWKERLQCIGHTRPISSVSFSTDTRYIYTVTQDRILRRWKLDTGGEEEKTQLAGTTGFGFVFSPDKTAVLSYTFQSETAQLLDITTGQIIRQFTEQRLVSRPGPSLRIISADFSPDGRYLLTGRDDGIASLWDTEAGTCLRQFNSRAGIAISSVAYAKDGNTILMVSSSTGSFRNVTTGVETGRISGQTTRVAAMAFSPNGSYLCKGGGNNAYLIELGTGQVIRQFVGHTDEINAMTFSPDGKLLLTGGRDVTARLWDVATGKELQKLNTHGQDPSLSFSPDARYVLTYGSDTVARLWETASGKEICQYSGILKSWTSRDLGPLSPNGRYVLAGCNDRVARLWETETGKEVRQFAGHAGPVSRVAFSPDGKLVITVGEREQIAHLWETETGTELRQFTEKWPIEQLCFSPDGQYVLTASAGTACVWETMTGKLISQLTKHSFHITAVLFSSDGREILTGGRDHTVRLWEAATGKEKHRLFGHVGPVSAVSFFAHDRFIITSSWDTTTRIWDAATGKELCQLLTFANSDWAVVTPEGRFDTNNLDNIDGLCWVMPDDPLHAIPFTVFLRQYYEPQLLSKLLHGAKLPDVPPLMAINRVQPIVVINTVELTQDGKARVTVTMKRGARDYQVDGKTVRRTAEVHDLRCFRDGQLVWHVDGEIKVDAQTGELTLSSVIPLPRRGDGAPITFTAYAFNEDQVKSETARKEFSLPKTLPVKGRAYVISVGINRYDAPTLNLRFAVNDAQSMQQALIARLTASGQYSEVVGVSLLSTDQQNLATKANVKIVLDTLAGWLLPESGKNIPGAAKIKLVQPEDVVILTWSGHGYASANGAYYLIPSDIGASFTGITPEALKRMISSDELSRWLINIDAGDMTFIIDACQSAASVAGQEFKPGPMGSRGLGQVAYDKGMRVLAASQADNVAVESANLRHGLLTFALVESGLENRKAVKDGKITLENWLQYGVDATPKLYADLQAGAMKGVSLLLPTPTTAPTAQQSSAPETQIPALFSFRKGARDVVLETMLAPDPAQ